MKIVRLVLSTSLTSMTNLPVDEAICLVRHIVYSVRHVYGGNPYAIQLAQLECVLTT